MINTLTRDQILTQGLDMADLPELDQHDRPNGIIVATALSINWLQRAIDAVLAEFPWGGEVTNTSGNLNLLNTPSFPPANFIRDIKGGLLLKIDGSTKQMIRRNWSDILAFQAKNDQGGNPQTGQPSLYSFRGTTLSLDVTPQQTYGFTLWYYAMPAALASVDVPLVPSDHALVDFIFLRAMEFARKAQPGSAMKWFREVEMAAIRTSDLGTEPESDHIMLDPIQFRGARRRPWDWMGTTRPNF